MVRGAVIDVAASPPRMQLQDAVFELHHRDSSLDGPLYLQLPLVPCGLFMPAFQPTTFLPIDHWLHRRSMNAAVAGTIARLAGMEPPRAKELWVDPFLQDDDEFPPWLLGDMVNVRQHTHIAQQLRTTFWIGDDMGDETSEPDIRPGGASTGRIHRGMRVTAFYRHANLPRVHLSLAGTGAPPPSRHPSIIAPTASDHLWWKHAQATLDMAASRPFISLSFARSLGYVSGPLNTQAAKEIMELSFRPCGWHQLSVYEHRARYWGLGTLTIKVNMATCGHSARLAIVVFMVFDDSCLPTNSFIEVVLHSAFALQLQG